MAKLASAIVSRLVIIIPYAWLLFFFLIPFFIVFRISLSQTAVAMPPYMPVFDLAGGLSGIVEKPRRILARQLRMADRGRPLFQRLYIERRHRRHLRRLLTLLIGYPIAYGMAKAPRSLRPTLLMDGDPALLDELSDPRLCLDRHPEAGGPAQPGFCRRSA